MNTHQRMQVVQLVMNLQAEMAHYDLLMTQMVYRQREEAMPKRKKPKRLWVKPWRAMRPVMGQFVLLMDHLRVNDVASFKNMMRVTPDKFFEICNRLQPRIEKQNTSFRDAIEPACRLAIALRYYASGDKYISLDYNYLVAHNTVGKIVNEVSEAIINEYEEVIDTPVTSERWKEVEQRFAKRWNFHHALGALDGKHVAIRCPGKTGTDFYNYKKFYSIILLALVDGAYRFLWLDVGANGSCSDAQIWNRCELLHAIEDKTIDFPEPQPLPGEKDEDVPYFIIGDDAFALRTYMMKPYSARQLTHQQKVFNYRLSRARRIVENAFGILAQRFQCLLTTMRQTPEHVTAIVIACCCLHNILINDNPNLARGMVDEEDEDHDIVPGSWRDEATLVDGTADTNSRNTSSKQGKEVRDYLCTYYNSPKGEVPWQDAMVGRR